MILKEEKKEEIIIGDFEQINSKISKENTYLMLSTLSKNFYSKPIESFLREIVSNAWDANTEANSEMPVKVIINDNEIKIKDFGMGMSPDKFENIFMSWFSSDKKETNNLLGAFGLGSKSPFSYCSSFYIETISDGILYLYHLTDIDKAILLDKKEVEITEVGTTVIIPIKNNDSYRIHSAATKTLVYFDNVILNSNYYYNNNFSILKTSDFITTSKNYDLNLDYLHICLGQVYYPLNFSAIDRPSIILSVGLYFDIGELDIIKNREEIQYTDETILKLQMKYDTITEYFKTEAQNTIQNITLKEFLTDNNNLNFITLNKIKIRYDFQKIDFFKLKELTKNNIEYIIYTLFDFNLIVNKNLSKKKILLRNIFNCNFYYAKNSLNKWDNIYIENGIVVHKKKISKDAILNIKKKLFKDDKSPYAAINIILKEFKNYLETGLKYDNIASDDFIKNYKNAIKDKKIIFYDFKNGYKKNVTVENLLNKKYNFYVIKNNEKDDKYLNIINYLPYWFLKNVNFIMFAKVNEKTLLKTNKFYHASNIFKIKELSNHFKRVTLRDEILKITNKAYFVENFCDFYYKNYKNLIESLKKRCNYTINEFFDEIQELHSLFPPKYLIIEEDLKILKQFYNNYKVLAYVKPEIPKDYLKQIIIKFKLLKLNIKYYEN